MKQFLCTAIASFVLSSIACGDGFQDDFSDAKLKTRQALRGEWKFENGIAHCVSDPELYKKFANHGPILRWPAEFTDGTLEFEFQPKDCERVVITLNEKGHVFRMSFHEPKKTRFFGWIGQSSKTNKPKVVTQDGIPSINDLNGKWVKAKIVFQGNSADVTYGDYHSKLKHECIGRKKGEFTISFASGEISVRNVKLTVPE